MPKTQVWHSDEGSRNKSKPKQTKKTKKSQKEQNKKEMADEFWDSHIESGDTLIFTFISGFEIRAKVLVRDKFYLKVMVNDKEWMVFKHALKYVEKA